MVGLSVATERDDHVRVQLRPVDPIDQIVLARSRPQAIADRWEAQP